MPENWTYQYLNVLVHQGKRTKVNLGGVIGVDAMAWLKEQDIDHEITWDPDSVVASFYFERPKDALLFKLRWSGA